MFKQIKSPALKMHHKLILIFIVLVLIPMTSLSMLTYRNYTHAMELNTSKYVSQVSGEVLKRISSYSDGIKRLTTVPLYLTPLQKALTGPGNSAVKSDELEMYAGVIMDMQEGINTVIMADNAGNLFYSATNAYVGIQDNYAAWKQAAVEGQGNAVVVGTQLIQEQRQTRYSLTVVRQILDLNSFKPLGIIVIQADLSVLESSIRELDGKTKGKTLLFDKANRIVFDSENKRQNTLLQDPEIMKNLKGEESTFALEQDGVSYLCVYRDSPDIGWGVLIFIKRDQLLGDTLEERNWNVFITIAAGLIALACTIVVAVALTKPLRKLSMLMKVAEKGDLTVRFELQNRDETGQVGMQFNRMLRKIQELIRDTYEINHRKKAFELEALQSQINPHFIYNTLELIRYRAELNEDRDVSHMVVKLGKLIRYGIIRDEAIVTVQEELDHLQTYLEIQNERFKHQVELRIDIHPSLYHLEIMKLVFQPIVENVILHGYEKMQRSGVIVVTSYFQHPYCVFVVEDDGAGMSAERLAMLRKRLQSGEREPEVGKRGGFGLLNVHERIRLHYGSECGLEIDSKAGVGTKVSIRLPFDEEELFGC